jgi:hypothetical protein
MMIFLLLFVLHCFAQFKSFQDKLSIHCPEGTKSVLLYTQDPTQNIQSFSIRVEFQPSLILFSVKDSYELSTCSSIFELILDSKWSIAATSFGFTGNSAIYEQEIKDTYAGIESSLSYGYRDVSNLPQRFSKFASLQFSHVGGFHREIIIAPKLIRWSECNDTFNIDFYSSIQIDSIYDHRFLALDKQQVFFSFKKCD